jgi:hypothetical protein
MPGPLRQRTFLAIAVMAALLAAEDVYAADPTLTECVAANEKAGPLEHAGKLRAARASLMQCVALSCPALVRDDCIKGETRVELAIPSVVFVAKDPAGNDLSAVRVSVDGVLLADKLLGNALDVDPGEHSFKFEAVGLPPLEKSLIIQVGEKNRRESVVLGAGVGRGRPNTPAALPPMATTEQPRTSGATQKVAGIAIGGIGALGIVVGSVFGLEANAKWKDAEKGCSPNCAATATARTDATQAHQYATVANIALPVGGAAVLAGIMLWTLVPRAKAMTGARFVPFFTNGPFTNGQGVGVAAVGDLP